MEALWIYRCNLYMAQENTYLSVILPVYNSGSFLRGSLGDLDECLGNLSQKTELIVVDDGSRDNSLEIANEWSKTPRKYAVRVIGHDKNMGKGAAVATGMLQATGKYRIFLDADLAYPPSQISTILKELEGGFDVVTANRVHEETRYTISPSFFHYLYTRHLASRIINWFLRWTIIPHCHDSQAGLKGFTANAANLIFERQMIKGFSFDIEVLYLAEKLGLKTKEAGIEYRYFSEPTTVAFLQDGLKLVSDIARIYANSLRGSYRFDQKKTKKLVINADDFGMTLPISRGILKACAAGTVRSLSVMANSPDFEKSMAMLASSEVKPDVGFHATLTWGRPVLDPKKVPTIVDGNGNFFSRGKLLLRSMLKKIDPEEAYLELKAQYERLAKSYPQIFHMDGHHHVHIFPVVREAAERVAREFQIPVVRSPGERSWSPWHRAPLKRSLTNLLSASGPAYWRSRGFFTTDNFGGFSLSANRNLLKRWTKTFERLPKGLCEIMVHPGYTSTNDDPYNEEREQEVSVLSDPSFSARARSLGVEFVSFREALQEKQSL